MFPMILDAGRQDLLRTLCAVPSVSRFYLAGGTALSLQLGLRQSHDFDFFTPERFNESVLFDDLRNALPGLTAVRVGGDTCDVLADGVQISFFRYPCPTVGAPVGGEPDFPALRMACVDDIAAMKLAAVGSRGSRKDFYDLYQIFRRVPGFTPAHLLDIVHRKFGAQLDVGYMIVELGYFADAESEILPKTYVPADWEDIRAFMVRMQQTLFALEAERFTAPPP